ncbi:DUF6146 family protein [Marinifilum sp.]|uniref:DUF6146 family protein n=1 Tax=Marinifilum sp. TaxID=2033137 RepID=UPI003BAD880C
MKYIGIVVLALILFAACSSYSSFNQPSPVYENEENTELAQVKDSTEYELLILDIGFETWFAARNMPSMARADSYYQNWNHRYVIEWNNKHSQGHPYFENYIDYDPFEDYGFDLNYKLYHYFQFVEEKTGIILVQRGRGR